MIDGALDGGVRSSVYDGPLKSPLPLPVPPSLFPAMSLIESSSASLRPSVPSPEPVDAVTVYDVPDPLTPVIDVPERPAPVRAKSVASTPVTVSLNVTVQRTDEALVGVASRRVIPVTDGDVRSTTHV